MIWTTATPRRAAPQSRNLAHRRRAVAPVVVVVASSLTRIDPLGSVRLGSTARPTSYPPEVQQVADLSQNPRSSIKATIREKLYFSEFRRFIFTVLTHSPPKNRVVTLLPGTELTGRRESTPAAAEEGALLRSASFFATATATIGRSVGRAAPTTAGSNGRPQ